MAFVIPTIQTIVITASKSQLPDGFPTVFVEITRIAVKIPTALWVINRGSGGRLFHHTILKVTVIGLGI